MSGCALVTIVHGRGEHLRAQHASLAAEPPADRPDHWVVVAMDDPSVAAWRPASGPVPEVVDVPTTPHGLPLAAARNAGARRARALGCDVVVFLDVDCLAGPGCVAAYRAAARRTTPGPPQIWCGPVTYLDPPPPGGYDLARLGELDAPHPARPAPAPGEEVAGTDWALFWSLSFALRLDDLERLGGFCERYVGYGGEDTDLAQVAAAAGLGLTWLGSARAYHQHHPVSRPPVEHAADIVRNAGVFHDRWGWWPMAGWLHDLEQVGAVRRTDERWELVDG